MCWRFLRDFWVDFVFACEEESSEDTDGASDIGLDGPGAERAKGIAAGRGKEA